MWFLTPDHRLHPMHLFGACLIFLIWRLKQKSSKDVTKLKWLDRNSWLDVALLILNTGVISWIVSYGLSEQTLRRWLIDHIISWSFSNEEAQPWLWGIAWMISFSVLDDLSRYGLHRALHEIPWLWKIHRVHHSATALNPVSQYRVHPLESLLFWGRACIVYAVTVAFFYCWSGGHIEWVLIFGVTGVRWLFLFFGSNLRHSPLPIKWWHGLELVWISPFQHQLHHSISPEHWNKNYGSHWAVWDRYFGTLLRSKDQEIRGFGLNEKS